jgi:pimeloyl-ACP methyl ester carboxylesterase
MRLCLAVLLCAACAAPAAAARPGTLSLTGGGVAVETVCGAVHGVRVTADAGRVAVRARARATLRLARCEHGRWVRAADRRTPGEYRLALRNQRRFVRVLEAVTETPVAFRVQNVNRSLTPCTSDGQSYELRGTLAAPTDALEAHRLGAVTLYLHEFGFGSWFWHFTDVAGYDTIHELAARGHASVTIDRLGYAPSAKPNGQATCLGAQADMAHQVVGQLRSRYGAPAVAIAGHSVGGAIAELEAESFGDVKALALAGWADQGFSEMSTQAAVEQAGVCMRKGGEPDDYAYFVSDMDEFKAFDFHDGDPAVIAASYAHRNPDPCGDSTSQLNVIAVNNAHNGDLAIPVLLLFGADDPVFSPDAPDMQAQAYRSSPSVKLVRVPRTAHAMTLERAAPLTRDALVAWLDATGL